MKRPTRPLNCPSCGKATLPAAGLYRCTCGKSWADDYFEAHDYATKPLPPRDQPNEERVRMRPIGGRPVSVDKVIK
jgi:ribosomal protein S27AE